MHIPVQYWEEKKENRRNGSDYAVRQIYEGKLKVDSSFPYG